VEEETQTLMVHHRHLDAILRWLPLDTPTGVVRNHRRRFPWRRHIGPRCFSWCSPN